MLGKYSYMTMGAIGTALLCGSVYDYIHKKYLIKCYLLCNFQRVIFFVTHLYKAISQTTRFGNIM
ncbi:hypothetical protein DPMN_031680 [Dreissena polymorpha]|uniref:Uncharacterized protein n=1 Tax=Dreissena polymorpha TaxID=45954 RepID=A0A9D4RJJ6_DREPO|nr:hypothetical protein DPMN_031680 [Dreissena polymorpha]